MIIAKSMDVRDNFKNWCGQVYAGEIVRISRPGNNYVYLINQETYEKLSVQSRMFSYLSYLNGKDKISNLKRLSEIENLPENWNGNGAERISINIIKTVRRLLLNLKYQPEIFPTACNAVQMEWDNNGEYLEMEVLEDNINVFQIDTDGNEIRKNISAENDQVKEIVEGFYDRAV